MSLDESMHAAGPRVQTEVMKSHNVVIAEAHDVPGAAPRQGLLWPDFTQASLAF